MQSIVTALCAGAALTLGVAAQEQVFLAPTGSDSSVAVSWVTRGTAAASEHVGYGAAVPTSSSATATSFVFDGTSAGGFAINPLRIHNAVLTGLLANTTYKYQLGGNASVTHSFVNAPARAGGKKYAVFADLGLANDVALAAITEDALVGVFDAVLHAGDFAYNFEDRKGENGNDFMNSITPIASRYPYAVARGNHEYE